LSEALATSKKRQTTPGLKTTVSNAANIFNVHALLHGICKWGHRFEVVHSSEESENERLQYLAVCTNLRWFLLSWYLTLCQIFCCCIIQGVGFNYHQRNVRSRISVSNFQVSVSEVTVSTTWLPC